MQNVASFYDRDPEVEWDRLIREPYRELEFRVTMSCFRRFAPPSGSVLDAGGGPGRYAIAFARLGHTVTLLDLSPGCVRFARDKIRGEAPDVSARVRECCVGDVRDLARFAAESFDAVVCLDALSHLPETADRRKAVLELSRVAKPFGLVLFSVRSFCAVVRRLAELEADAIANGVLSRLVSTGNTRVGGLDVHFFRVPEMQALCADCGLSVVEMAGSEGYLAGDSAAANHLGTNAAFWQPWLAFIASTPLDPYAVASSEHIVFVLEKRGA